MYCQNCGTPNEDSSVFCENCGSKLDKIMVGAAEVQPQPQVQVSTPQPAKQVSKRTMILVAEVIALCVVVYGITVSGKKNFSAEHVAEGYFVDVVNGDWDSAYEKLDLDESEFINKKLFSEANKEKSFDQVSNYIVEEDEFSRAELGKEVTIRYRGRGDGSDRSYNVSMNKQADKKYLFFEDWKVSSESVVYKDYIITVPKGAKVELDGIEVGKKYAFENDNYGDSLQQYKIPEVFLGNHNISVTMEGRKDVNDTITVDYYNESSYYLENMQMTEEALQEQIKTAGEDMHKIYAAVIDGKGFDAVEELFSKNEDYRNNIKDSYESLWRAYNEDDYNAVSRIEFSNITGEANSSGVNISFDYKVHYLSEDWWTGEITAEEYSNSSQLSFYFEQEDGKWVLTNLGCGYLYY